MTRGARFFFFVVASVAHASNVPSHFPGEPEQSDVDAEAVMIARAKVVSEKCKQMADYNSVDNPRLLWRHWEPPSLGTSFLVEGHAQPSFQVCSPSLSWPEAWREYQRDVMSDEDSAAKKSDKKVQSEEELNKRISRRLKVVAVTHPFTRLAKVYLNVVKDSKSGTKLDVVKKTYGVTGNLSFKYFVRFLINGAVDFANDFDVLSDEDFNRPWAPYYQDCPVCHNDNFPTFVVKSDSYNLEEEIELLQEVFGLEDFEFPLDKVEDVSDATLRELYSQLTKQEVADLAEFYRVDLDMYQYCIDKFLYYANDEENT